LYLAKTITTKVQQENEYVEFCRFADTCKAYQYVTKLGAEYLLAPSELLAEFAGIVGVTTPASVIPTVPELLNEVVGKKKPIRGPPVATRKMGAGARRIKKGGEKSLDTEISYYEKLILCFIYFNYFRSYDFSADDSETEECKIFFAMFYDYLVSQIKFDTNMNSIEYLVGIIEFNFNDELGINIESDGDFLKQFIYFADDNYLREKNRLLHELEPLVQTLSEPDVRKLQEELNAQREIEKSAAEAAERPAAEKARGVEPFYADLPSLGPSYEPKARGAEPIYADLPPAETYPSSADYGNSYPIKPKQLKVSSKGKINRRYTPYGIKRVLEEIRKRQPSIAASKGGNSKNRKTKNKNLKNKRIKNRTQRKYKKLRKTLKQ